MKKATLLLFIILSVNFSVSQETGKLRIALLKEFPSSSTKDGRWVYNDSSRIENLENPKINNLLPEYKFYKTSLTNFLGYHINRANCLILYNAKKSKVILVEPMWYGDLRKQFLKLLLGKNYGRLEDLKLVIKELQSLLLIGTSMYFTEPNFSDEKVLFNLDYPNQNKKSGVETWRNFEVGIRDGKFRYFKSTNPHIKESVIVK
ncbi:hypothetical protein HUK80_17405 [Flavobacterium sp. MAH-1]|uniref:Uncharacterized protein n=1 Tax=Flavobacterium agri TaxID=2743471 RepID=A0A7Y9C6V2_9FLAO|nr:hypothetical protein [Flavobacterium agri]NUY82683.1 hypothetical protein [Flavobacterium agri]NYA72706.1 hypothetical protein [Flavobacterium agri]